VTGDVDRYWPTPSAYALTITCTECGHLAFSCPCATADNAATGQSDDVGWHNHDDAANVL